MEKIGTMFLGGKGLLVLLLLQFGLQIQAQVAEPTAVADSVEMEEQSKDYCQLLKEAQNRLNQIFGRIYSAAENRPEFQYELEMAHRAWVDYRSAHVKAVFPMNNPEQFYENYKACVCKIKYEMTLQRIQILKQWDKGVPESEDCIGSRKVDEGG